MIIIICCYTIYDIILCRFSLPNAFCYLKVSYHSGLWWWLGWEGWGRDAAGSGLTVWARELGRDFRGKHKPIYCVFETVRNCSAWVVYVYVRRINQKDNKPCHFITRLAGFLQLYCLVSEQVWQNASVSIFLLRSNGRSNLEVTLLHFSVQIQ